MIDPEQVFRDGESYTAASCGGCNHTANVPTGRAIWECVCGELNLMHRYNTDIPHETPDIGPTAAQIRAAALKVRGPAAPLPAPR